MRLWIRLTLAFVVAALVSVVPFAAFVVNMLQRQAEAAALAELEQEAALLADSVARWAVGQEDFLAGWARPYSERLSGMDLELQTGLLNAVCVAMPSTVVVALVNEDGVAVAPPAFPEGVLTGDLSAGERAEMLLGRAPLTAAIEAGAAIGTPYRPPGQSMLSVPIAALATPAREGIEPLLLVAEVRLQPMVDIDRDNTPDHVVALISGQGEVFSGADHPLVDRKQLGALAQLAKAVGTFHLRDRDAIGGMRSVDGTDWILVVVRPASVASAQGTRVWSISMAFLSFSIALAMFVGWVLSYGLTEPVSRLRDSVLAVADGDYGRRTEVSSSDEIGELARAFNHMSARLLVNQQEIEEQHEQIVGFNEELQDRVDRRTQQLMDAQDQLVRSGQLAAVAEVGAGLAHELNNPLAAILGTTQLLRARSAGTPNAALLASLEEQAQRCREVVGAMVRFSSGEEVDPENAPVVDLRDVIVDVTTLVRGPFRQRGVTLQLEMSSDPLPVRLDPVHGSRILAQILNGLRAGLTDGTTLSVRAGIEGDEVVVVMAPDYPVAVDEFRRDDWMASGMGLWVARRLLDHLGGRLEQPVQMPWVRGMRPPATEEYDEDPSLPLLSDATWRVVLPRA